MQACKHSLICRQLSRLYFVNCNQLYFVNAVASNCGKKRGLLRCCKATSSLLSTCKPTPILPKLVKCCIGRCQILRVGDPPSNCCCAVILSIPSNTSTTTIMKNRIHGFMVSSTVCYRQHKVYLLNLSCKSLVNSNFHHHYHNHLRPCYHKLNFSN